jgi:nucleotide-binding universal stress UspA family protein
VVSTILPTAFSATSFSADPDVENFWGRDDPRAVFATRPNPDFVEVGVFERIVIGVEESPESLVAVRQAARLLAPNGHLLLAAVAEAALAVHAGWAATAVLEDIESEARAALDAARFEAPGANSVLLDGVPANALLETARSRKADLVAVGTHGGSRSVGILLGSVATVMLHDAPCSVLIARPSKNDARFPQSICVGVDGSPSSARAAEVARKLAHSFDAPLARVAACGGMKINLDDLWSIEPAAGLDHRPPVEALIERAREVDADLLVVGSRGVHGMAALGSVSERVAHRAGCSVLVVRENDHED